MPFIDLTTLLTMALWVYAGLNGSAIRQRWSSRLLVLLLLSPGLRYGSALFMFPIRLQLSAWAGSLLRLAGLPVQVAGNLLIKNNIELAVDPACMGLQLTGASLLVALFALIWQEQQVGRAVPFRWVLAYGITAFGLTIFCNLFRIMLLVIFEAMPGTWAHEGIGLVCVAVYAWLPAWALAWWLVHNTGKRDEYNVAPTEWFKSVGWGVGVLAVGIGLMAFATRPAKSVPDLGQSAQYRTLVGHTYWKNCSNKVLTNGTIKLAKPGVLVYLKPQPDWFSADHSLMVCWRGSGYELRRVRETVMDGHPVYAGELHKKGRVLHTVWWFSNGTITTISQLTLRSQMLRGESGFVLVNVTRDKLN